MMVHTYNLSTLGQRQEEDQGFKASLGYGESLRPAWAS